jgi:hypothetical protein
MPELTRREAMNGVAALAASRWAADGLDIADADEWEPPTGGSYETGTFEPDKILTSGNGQVADWMLDDADFTDRTLEVFYDDGEVHLAMDGSADAVRAGALATLTTEQARELGAALYQAGEELDRRPDPYGGSGEREDA